jgi:hypothetical protein
VGTLLLPVCILLCCSPCASSCRWEVFCSVYLNVSMCLCCLPLPLLFYVGSVPTWYQDMGARRTSAFAFPAVTCAFSYYIVPHALMQPVCAKT